MIKEELMRAIKFGPFNLVMNLKEETQKTLFAYQSFLKSCKNSLFVFLIEFAITVFLLLFIKYQSYFDPIFKMILVVCCAMIATVTLWIVDCISYILECRRGIRENKELLKIIYIRELKEKNK